MCVTSKKMQKRCVTPKFICSREILPSAKILLVGNFAWENIEKMRKYKLSDWNEIEFRSNFPTDILKWYTTPTDIQIDYRRENKLGN